MSRDNVHNKHKGNKDITWEALIKYSESEIEACREKIKRLRKSIVFFNKQAVSRVPLHPGKEGRHEELS